MKKNFNILIFLSYCLHFCLLVDNTFASSSAIAPAPIVTEQKVKKQDTAVQPEQPTDASYQQAQSKLNPSYDDIPHLPSDSSTLNNLKQLFFKSKELKDKAAKYEKLIEELSKRIAICKKLAAQAAIESEKIDTFIHSQLSKHQEIVKKIQAQTVSKYKMDEGSNTNVDKFLSEVAKQHDAYKQTPQYKEKVNEYMKMMENAKKAAEVGKKEMESAAPVQQDPNTLF